MATYGYVRKGFPINETDQLAQIMRYECDELFFDSQSLIEDVELTELLGKLQPKDRVVVINLQVFGKGLRRLHPLMTLFKEHNIQFISIDNQIDTYADPSFYEVFQLLLETDTECRSERMKQNIGLARQDGKVIGRPTLDEATIERIAFLYHEQKWSMRRIASECEVSLGSVYKYTQQEKQEAELSLS